MSDEREPLFVVPTPFPGASTVTLFRDTWADHIIKQHVDMAGKEAAIQAIVMAPTAVVAGNANTPHVIFINQSITSPGGTPLAVIVHPEEKIICTAYYNRSLKVISMEQVIWSP